MANGTSSCSIAGCLSPVLARGWCGRHYRRWARYGNPQALKRAHLPIKNRGLTERIWSKIDRRDGHWVWTAAIGTHGYGLLLVDGQNVLAHRLVYELLVQPIPDGLHLDHLCRVRHCVNPAHLEPVTPLENVRRGIGHGSETHCPHGHPYDQANTYRNAGRRHCRACRRMSEACRE